MNKDYMLKEVDNEDDDKKHINSVKQITQG
jgi:hypothetical protein